MRNIPRWTVDNSYLFPLVVEPTNKSEASLNQQMFDEMFFLQNGFNRNDVVAICPADYVDIKLREKTPVNFEAYSSKELPVNALDIPENDFKKYISPYNTPIQVTALIPKRQLRH